ncbi:NAD(P)-dependent dehydrogenase, short-chain alcohol dehydrogenase family [Modicisalibacter ilicicola DSM 19980]|uniref:NAD(P)-dependent dehydrogenase, short-chain alcohol dehydrogenase family n=1 Tax=Modicisalibacter ilicicola DSM 19980 TaxID=1121942 RepID=A0A1M4XEC3_9GAMM|nr:YciK family oxidoreductase [Halomonas ilicicola]SHE91947.1 NAD(P)-dependent dehydrogenase, short-chain alcohol dehydrogenase family [Halomonas ilicicola DSM 19980]
MTCKLDYQAPADLLDGRIILVTGAGDGIGRAAALTYARHGATVILLGRTIAKLEKVYDEIEQQGGPQPAIFPLNFEGATLKDYHDMAETLDKEFGRLDGLLHNAGLLGRITPFDQYNPELWEQVMQVNFNGPVWMTQALLPLLKASTDASVIFTSSSVGRKGRAYWGAYAASKFATEGFMEVLADELDNLTSIRVNSLNPGATRTQMRKNAFPAEDPDNLRTPDEIMPTYLWLMGPESRGHSGERFDAQPPRK